MQKLSMCWKYLLVFAFFSQTFCVLYSQETGAQDRIEQKVKRYLGWMADKSKPDIWLAASRLEKLGKEAIPILKKELKTLPEGSQVACAKVFLAMKEIDYGIQLLFQVIEKGQDAEAKTNAISLVGIYGDLELEDRLLQLLENTFEPQFKILLAKSIWQVSRNPQGTKIIKSFLHSDNTDLRYTAALALGEIGSIEEAKMVLAELKDEPSWRGRLAKAFLEQEALQNQYTRLLRSQSNAKPSAAKSRYPVVEEILDKIREYHVNGDKFIPQELIDAALKGMAAHTDPHSAFWTEKEWADFIEKSRREEYVGIGAYVGERNGFFTIIAPIYSGPAYRAGIRSMDKILEVDGWASTGKPVEEVVDHIRGVQGTNVKLKVYRDGWSQAREIEIKRENIQIPFLFSQMLPGKIGYLHLIQFGEKAPENLDAAITQMEADGMRGAILDLRGNGGGWLKAAIEIVELFVEPGKLIVTTQGRHPISGRKQEYYSTSPRLHPNFPLMVLVDQSSASASEIVAGTLQFYRRATLVGKKTFGKGSVQEPLDLDTRPGARLKLTIARYYLPDGRCIDNNVDSTGKILQHNGIDPDISMDYEAWEPWKNEEVAKIEEKNAFKQYVERYYDANRELFGRLADNDQLAVRDYPGFEEWYQTLNTKASRDDVRSWLRSFIRRRVADDRGREYACDYLEDSMLQRAIVEVFKKLNLEINTVPEYQVFASKTWENKAPEKQK